MLNYSIALPVTHVLLFDEDAPQFVSELGDNTRLVSDRYKRLLSRDSDCSLEFKYNVIFAVPEASYHVASCQNISDELKRWGISTYVVQIKAEEMLLQQSKIGLLTCVLWCIAGVILLNEIPLTEVQADKLLYQANRFHYTSHHLALMKRGWFKKDYRFGLIRSVSSIGHLLQGSIARSLNPHSVSEILKIMTINCSKTDLFVVK